MKICPYCAHQNLEGVLFCEDCGQTLTEAANAILPTKQLQQSPDDLLAKATWGTARFGQNSKMVIHVRDTSEPVVIQLTKKIVIGRLDPGATQGPDLDLTPFGALEKGVSRHHAAILRGEDTLTLVDLGSVNGTHLNGQRLIPEQPRVLRDGDEVRLGKLVLHIYFK